MPDQRREDDNGIGVAEGLCRRLEGFQPLFLLPFVGLGLLREIDIHSMTANDGWIFRFVDIARYDAIWW